MTTSHPASIVVAGITVFLLGSLYDAQFAGLPYQDPTPEMQANWLFHGKVAGRIMLSGAVIVLAGAPGVGLVGHGPAPNDGAAIELWPA